MVSSEKSNTALIKDSSAGSREELVCFTATEDVHGDILRYTKRCLKNMFAAHVQCFEFSAMVKTTDVVA